MTEITPVTRNTALSRPQALSANDDPMPTIKAILFDKDGTLFGYGRVWGPIMSDYIDRGLEGTGLDEAGRREYKDRLIECTGAGVMMLTDGVNMGGTYPENQRDPRTSIGYTDDGVVYLLTCDGRRTFGAAGMTYKEIGAIFQTLGCVRAANLDGGGSAQMLIRHPIADVWQIRNRPSDGAERPVINGWAVIVEEP